MSKIKLLTIAVIGLLIMNLATVTFLLFRTPQHRADGRLPMEQGGPKNIIINKLKFDKEQVTLYESLIEQHQVAIKMFNDSIKTAKNNLYHLLTEENTASKDSAVAKLGFLQKQIELTHYNHFAAIRAICKPNQLQAFNNLTKELARYFAPLKKD